MIAPAAGDPFAAAFATTRMPMLITDPRQPDNPVVFVNAAFEALTGYSREEVVGRNCRFLQGAETDPDAIRRIRDAVKAGQATEVEILNYRRDGTPFWNALVISPVRDGAGGIVYYFASQHDISAKKEAEAELRRAKEGLEAEVASRTRALQAALDQKTALLHEVDHRVKNNLQVVSSLVLLKARRIKDAGAQRVLGNVAERISAISTVHRLLYAEGDVSRFDLAAFIRNLADDLIAGVGPGRVSLDLELEAVAVPAAKATSLALVINELATNSLRHAFPGDRGGRLRIACRRQEGSLRVVVEDDGVGLRDGAPQESFGLTLVGLLARQLRGTIAYEDAGPGTRAVLSIPFDARELAAEPRAANHVHG